VGQDSKRKTIMKTLAIVWLLLIASALLAGIHPPNQYTLCARLGCGHYKFSHANGNGPCEYSDPYTLPGHCPGFIKAGR
jgi:hypothetical protein